MPRSGADHPEKARRFNLLQEFDNSLPDFKNLNEEKHLKFVRAIRMICAYFNVSEARLQKYESFSFNLIIVRLSELYQEYCGKDPILASAISVVKLHIESYYLDGQDADLVHNLTGLLTYPLNPQIRAKGESAAL